MTGGGDDRPRRSWAEIDRLRDKPRERQAERRPQGAAAEARARTATDQYLKKLDGSLFAKDAAGPEGDALAATVREAHGSPALADACRAYLAAAGPPADTGLLALFLDARDADVQVAALDRLLALQQAGELEASRGLRSQIRVLADDPNDDVASRAEELRDAF